MTTTCWPSDPLRRAPRAARHVRKTLRAPGRHRPAVTAVSRRSLQAVA
jgi:hypothetical protein